jgi:SAM-dependent methyltransferase
MDAEHLDFPDATFDAVLCGFGLMFFPRLQLALQQILRVLKPGGRFGASTWRVSQSDDLAAVLDELALGGPRMPGWITDPEQLAQTLGGAGFQDVDVRVDTTAFRYDGVEHYWQNAMGTGERRRVANLTPDELQRVQERLKERLASNQRPDGLHVEASALLATAHIFAT